MDNKPKYLMSIVEIIKNENNEIEKLIVDLERIVKVGENLENKKINKENFLNIIDETYNN